MSATPAGSRGWLAVWNGAQRLYVDDRHRALHFRHVAEQVVALVPARPAHVLDYGPGDALHAGDVADAVGRVTLCEASDLIRGQLRERFAGHPRVTVLAGPDPGAVADGSVDLLVVNSVVQYLDRSDLEALLAEARRLLAPDGRLVVGDVVPPADAPVAALGRDVGSMLRYAARHGFLGAAVRSLVATALSPYTLTRMRLGLTTYGEDELRGVLAAAGFTARRHHPNLSHDRARLTVVAHRSTEDAAAPPLDRALPA